MQVLFYENQKYVWIVIVNFYKHCNERQHNYVKKAHTYIEFSTCTSLFLNLFCNIFHICNLTAVFDMILFTGHDITSLNLYVEKKRYIFAFHLLKLDWPLYIKYMRRSKVDIYLWIRKLLYIHTVNSCTVYTGIQ